MLNYGNVKTELTLLLCVAGIEDLMNWHGKPLGAKTEEVIKEIQSKMSNSESLNLRPQSITATVPKIDISNIKLAEPPKYELGQQVEFLQALGIQIPKTSKISTLKNVTMKLKL